MDVKLGQVFQITRNENPSTGFVYFSEELTDGLILLKSAYIKDESEANMRLFGKPGYHLWVIKAEQSGRQKIKIYYGQEWDDSTWEIENINIYVSK